MLFDSVLNVGGVLARNGIALAPMAGVADVPFRQLAWELGAGYLVSEMVSSLWVILGYQEKPPTSGFVERCLSECDPNSRKRPY
ncbi:MAG: hypothetical protein Ct9H90mP27_2530 [Gammaproteobacteria bacterium]|nr:MAG: hypothetical protein Ct9H90mP27_2530 [Gammaproteobacteria bacterium]